VHKAHILINNRRHGEVGEAPGFGSMFGEFVGFFISWDAFMPWHPSDSDTAPGLNNGPCSGDNKLCQILTRAGEAGYPALNCHLCVCEDGRTMARYNLRAESGHCLIDCAQLGIEHLLIPAEIEALTLPKAFRILVCHPASHRPIVKS
jgi:hypothetical protein